MTSVVTHSGVRTTFGKKDNFFKEYTGKKGLRKLGKLWKKKKEKKSPPKKFVQIKTAQFEACCNPFHYLELANPKEEPTETCRCIFSLAAKRSHKLRNLT